LQKLHPTAIVIVEADPQEIFNRRAKDTTRDRDPDSIEKIAEHQMINRAAAMSYATLTGATVKIVFNHDNAIDQAVKEAKPVIR
jgi:adenylate kinase